ncbi:MAG: FKBP-type peptidyl-prolyl cis-trans isomerase [Bacteroidia bacterium]
MKKTILLTAAALLTLGACKNNSKFPGYEETSGAYFKMEKASGNNTAINKGDVVFMRYDILTDKDSSLFNYKTMSQPGRPLAVRIGESAYKGDMFEMMLKMHQGDSVSFAIRVDSIFKKSYHQPIPKYLDSTGFIVYHVKVDSIYTSQKVEDMEKKQKAAQEAFSEKAKNAEDSLIKKYLADNKITVKPTESGLYIVVKEKGKGAKLNKGDNAEVNYKGMLTNGQVFDASEKAGKPFTVGVGMQQVIPAWDEALQTMNVGTKILIISPSALAYGPNGNQGIPPYAPLVFEMEVVKASPGQPAPPAQK